MSDVTLTITDATPVALSITDATPVALSITDATPVAFESSSTSVALSITESTPVALDFNCFDMAAFLATVEAYDSDADAVADGKSYYKASSQHEAAYKGTFIIL